MDIQISSNFERYLFELFDRDHTTLTEAMNEFKSTGRFSIGNNLLEIAQGDFLAHRCDDQGTLDIIRNCYADTGEILDPHTAVGLSAALEYQDKLDSPIVTLACAHAAKFPDAVEKAIGIRPPLPAKWLIFSNVKNTSRSFQTIFLQSNLSSAIMRMSQRKTLHIMTKPRLTTLPNGLRVISDNVPSMHSVALGIWSGVGTRYEDMAHNGAAHMVEHMLFKGHKNTRRTRKLHKASKALAAI